jgi:rfaE bifunctional protein kinase chain/domain
VTTVFVSGNFSILHPGHIRLFQLAKTLGDSLIIGVNSDETAISPLRVPIAMRLESVKAIQMVNQVIVVNGDLERILLEIKPDIILKGREHEYLENIEQKIVTKYGGKLIFGSGDFVMSTRELLSSIEIKSNVIESPGKPFLMRHAIKLSTLEDILEKSKKIRAVVVGDLIVDEYIDCESIGLSQEDPSVIFRPFKNKQYVGGAGIVSMHSSSIGVSTTYIGVAGDDTEMRLAKELLENVGVNAHLFIDSSRQTILKQRFKSGGKTQFRLNRFDEATITHDMRQEIVKSVEMSLENSDLLIFSDFNYGLLNTEIVSTIIEMAKAAGVFIAADCQISSQIADFLRYKGVDLVTPTEHEVRVTLRNNQDGLAAIANKFQGLVESKYLMLTLGADGVLLQERIENEHGDFRADVLPALNANAQDITGAGDSFLILASLALAVGASVNEAAYLGSIGASVQVSRVGNTPITMDEIRAELHK